MSESSKPLRPWVVPVAVVLVAAALILTVIGLNSDTDTDQSAQTSSTTANSGSTGSSGATAPPAAESPASAQPTGLAVAERRDPNDVLAVGDVDAPVIMVVFSDYQCSYCAKWTAQTQPALQKYVDSGELRLEFRDLNIYGPVSKRAATAAYAAGLQGKFPEYHSALYAGGVIRSEDALSKDALVALANELQLDTAKFAADMEAPATIEEIETNSDLGLDLGATSTPSFILAGEPIVGAQPTDVFIQGIEKALAQAD